MPKATVAAIVTADNGGEARVLLTRRNVEPFKDKWCLPGGHIDQYEPAHQAIVREVEEETGLDFDARFFRYFDEIIPEHSIHAVVIVFAGRGSGQFNVSESEVTDIRWFSVDEARSMSLAFAHNEILNAYATRIDLEGASQ